MATVLSTAPPTSVAGPVAGARPRLLIIELDYHAEVLTTLCPILAERFDLVLWTTDKIWKKIGLPEQLFAAALVMPKKHPVRGFWQARENTLRAVDLVYFNTLEKHFAFFAQCDFGCPTIMRIHNTNASLFPADSIDWSLGNSWKILSYFVRHVLLQRSWHYKNLLYRRMDLLMLPGAGVVARMGARARARGFANISDYSLPFSCLGAAAPAPAGDSILFAVTGSVDASRKNYDVLLQALTRLREQQPTQKLTLVFLGWAKGERARKIINRFAALADDTFQVQYFPEYVSQQTFADWMARIHFLVAPLKLRAQHKIHREFYGETKISGIENDALCYRKPIILPADYTLPSDLARIALAYHSADSLCAAIAAMIDDNHWRLLTDRFDSLSDYERERIAANFFQLYRRLAAVPSTPAA